MGYSAAEIDRDCYIIENHAEPGMLGGVMGRFNEQTHHEITERGMDVVEFARRFTREDDVLMLNCVALCDVLHRSHFFMVRGMSRKSTRCVRSFLTLCDIPMMSRGSSDWLITCGIVARYANR